MTNYGPDGYGAAPSREVVKAVKPFFGDESYRPDTVQVAKIGKQIKDREDRIPWKSRSPQ